MAIVSSFPKKLVSTAVEMPSIEAAFKRKQERNQAGARSSPPKGHAPSGDEVERGLRTSFMTSVTVISVP